ncbi:DUF2262 domain-containing protein [Saccharibacillus alkalitolerans]|uniref:DUF2262 domain-containing protein n=1 Tax=Saccharibacillus alkalitolerans TaxID=2705290 RepID=A0ABX0F6S1_9BACL|nr:DUF2262 domain-containing protein [Saccharibacillus alkalitolerans]NGZ75239.1 DUF2262 domain-containing protein [Saccharibacillus alkalitolerans]
MYYGTDKMTELLKRVYAREPGAREELDAIEAPHALSADGTALVLLQFKHAQRLPSGRIRILSKAPEPDAESFLCADLYRCLPSGGTSWTHIPVPGPFGPASVFFEESGAGTGAEGRFVFESADGRRASASMAQMGMSFRQLDLIMEGAEESEIEEEFYAMGEAVVPPPPIKRTAADNPPIGWAGGLLTFKTELQWFEGEWEAEGRRIDIRLQTPERKRALELLPILEQRIAGLESTDTSARRLAADELLDAKNDFWLDEDEEEATPEQFAGLMELESLTLDEDGDVALWYDDGELFAGHTICVRFDAAGVFLSADMMG